MHASQSSAESVISITFADMVGERRQSVMKFERSVITMTLLRLGYLVHRLGNYTITLPTETGLRNHCRTIVSHRVILGVKKWFHGVFSYVPLK